VTVVKKTKVHPQPQPAQDFHQNLGQPGDAQEAPNFPNQGIVFQEGLGLGSLKDNTTDPNIRRTLDNKYLLIRTIG
jgi:hypothetical protein